MRKKDSSEKKKEEGKNLFVSAKDFFGKRKKLTLFLTVLVIVLGLLYYFRGQFVVATVNGQPIWRWQVIKELEKQGGKSVVDSLVTKALIFQEAKKKNISVGLDEIKKGIKEIEEEVKSQGQELDSLLEMQGLKRSDLEEQVRMQKLVEKMAGEVKVTDKEVEKYIEENKEGIPEDADMDEVRKNVKGNLRQQKLNEKIQSWLDSLREKAKIDKLLGY